ncbi:LegC family aminotransferase [Legionella fallonii]|uniref:DegT/DnrJ/EryC1/StrS aminotransferase n=1 Tax=Legionella fallonii LLAP-10 TaxID=1212491 RepID=A0A098G2M8_9GAMM|nr:LegC family aminotransferase [Legionella fallonii]CEG56244.1 DegT/DnrJ/EryC1/StrS aminotransferase [Legionella fallonii LLAP-10]
MIKQLISFLRDQYQTEDFIPLHAPQFIGNEKAYVLHAIDSTFVSSVGAYVDQFERDVAKYTESPCAVVTVNGTSALHCALLLAGVKAQDYVITQPLTFVATCNAIAYCNAEPIFIDVDRNTLGLSPQAVDAWLDEFSFIDEQGYCRHKQNHRIIRACVPMHTFGHPVDLDGLLDVCRRWNLKMIEDAAESLGSLYKGRHTGTLGELGILSFNGNKIITTGGGGMILTNQELGQKAKHLTTTAKKPHPYEYVHDEIGYNYRMPNINAAMGCAQLEQLEFFIEKKRELANSYIDLFKNSSMQFIVEPAYCRSNYWLNAVICDDLGQRNELLQQTNDCGVMTRPIWHLMNQLPIYKNALCGSLSHAEWLVDRVVNLPSSVIIRG